MVAQNYTHYHLKIISQTFWSFKLHDLYHLNYPENYLPHKLKKLNKAWFSQLRLENIEVDLNFKSDFYLVGFVSNR